MIISNKVTVYKHEPAYDNVLEYAKKTLVLDNPEYTRKERMGLWLGKTPRKIYLYDEKPNCIILPFGAAEFVLSVCDECSSDFSRNAPIEITGDVNLYDYQETALARLLEAGNGVLVSPAGSGKTQIGIALIRALGLKTLWVTNKSDLLAQSRDRFKAYCTCSTGTITAGKVQIGDVTFATVQTLTKLDLSQYAYEWDLIIVDECQNISTASQLAMFNRVLGSLKARNKVGLTAVLHRADGLDRGVTAMLGDVCCEIPREAVAGRTVNPKIVRVELDTPRSFEYANTDGTMNYTKLVGYLCADVARTAKIVDMAVENAGESQIILSDRICHLKAILDGLALAGLGDISVMIDGSMVSKKGKAEREQAIEDMRTGKKRILLASVSLAKEGLDVTCLSRLHITTPVKDKSVVIQAVGRISRVHPGKGLPIVYDYIDTEIGYCLGASRKRAGHYRSIGCEM